MNYNLACFISLSAEKYITVLLLGSFVSLLSAFVKAQRQAEEFDVNEMKPADTCVVKICWRINKADS